jgi:hypothetical protein
VGRGNGQTNFRSKRALEVNPHPWTKRVLDPKLGRALGLGTASRSDCRVSNADKDAQTRHFEGSLGLGTPRAELVSARPNLLSHRFENQQTTEFVPGMRLPVCILRLLVAFPCLFVREMDRRGGIHRS